MKKINNLHDKFVKEMLAEKELAIAFLETILPEEELKILDLETLEFSNTNFITTELEEYFSDIVFKVRLKNSDKQKYISILLEHKSYMDNTTIIQLGKYLFNAYDYQLKQNKELHLIVPVIYYNGSKNWKVKNMLDLLKDTPKELEEYIPKFKFVYINLASLSENQILQLQNEMLASSLLVQKYRHNPGELVKKFNQIITTLEPYQNGNFITKIIVYILNISESSKFEIYQIIKNNTFISEEYKNKIMSTADYLRAEGIAEGKAEGIAEGFAEATAKAVEEKEMNICNAFQKLKNIEMIAEIFSMAEEEVKGILQSRGIMEQ